MLLVAESNSVRISLPLECSCFSGEGFKYYREESHETGDISR